MSLCPVLGTECVRARPIDGIFPGAISAQMPFAVIAPVSATPGVLSRQSGFRHLRKKMHVQM
jgi:hypothetical protein